jgi:tetratricopeptide (TPR) repeat protein
LVNNLCELVGNLPLAIELLAPQAVSLPLTELETRVKASLAAIAADSPALPQRHREIIACFRVSFDRLSAAAQQLLPDLSGLPDGIGANLVGDFTGVAAWQDSIRECVGSSLLRFDGERYRFHPLVRRFAFEQLGAAQEAWQRGFIAFFRQLVMDNDDINDHAKLAVLTAEWRNAVAAAETAEELKEWDAVNRVSEYLGGFLLLRGLWSERERLNLRALAAARAAGNRQNEGGALNNLGVVYDAQGRWAEAEASYQQSLAIKREFGDRVGEGTTLNNLGVVYDAQGRWAEAEASYQQSLAIKREFGDRVGEGITLHCLGNLYTQQKKWAEAETCYQQSLTKYQEVGDRPHEGWVLQNFAQLHEAQGDIAGALELGRQGIAVLERTQDTRRLAEVRELVARWEGQVSSEQ